MRTTNALALLAALGGASACRHDPQASTPASQPASRPASQPASHPAGPSRLDVELVRTASLSAQRLREHVFYLASDELEGRGPNTAGLGKAADYLAKQLEAAGARPAFGDGYRQPFEMLVGVGLGDGNSLEVGEQRFELGADLLPYTFSSVGEVTGQPIFAGYGIRSEDHDWDDYAGLDVKDRVVVVLAAEPGDEDPKSPFDGRRRTAHAFVRAKLLLAREAGAKALLVVHEDIDPSKPGPTSPDAGLPVARISPAAAEALLGFDVRARQAEIDAAYEAKNDTPPDRPEATLRLDLERKRRTVHNVAGVIGPEAAAEVVVLGAHYDHLGMGGESSLSGTDEPRVHNGADDNASGTAVVLEVARALAAQAEALPRRVLFVLFAGEEDGLLGSSHFVEHPPVKVEDMVAMLNLDMVGRLRESRLNFMGVKTATELATLAAEAVEGRALQGTYGGDGYGPSDHTPFFAAGVPVLFLFTGAHENYHKPSDDPDTLNYPGMAKVGAVAADLISALARAKGRPTYVEAKPPPKGHPGGGRGYGPYFGSIPDFGQEVKGVRFAGVRPGSPADEAGVQKGDVLVEFGGLEVQNLQDFTVALRRHAPGDTVTVKVKRGGKTLELTATLSRRE